MIGGVCDVVYLTAKLVCYSLYHSVKNSILGVIYPDILGMLKRISILVGTAGDHKGPRGDRARMNLAPTERVFPLEGYWWRMGCAVSGGGHPTRGTR